MWRSYNTNTAALFQIFLKYVNMKKSQPLQAHFMLYLCLTHYNHTHTVC